MSDPLARIKKLLALAVDSGASNEEARTAALICVKLIRSSGARIEIGPQSAPKSGQKYPDPPRPYPKSHPKWVFLRSKFQAWCTKCRCEVGIGDFVWWKRGVPGVRCEVCGEPD